MFQSFDDVQKLGKENFELASKSVAAVSKGLQTIAADAADYTRKSFEASSSTLEQLIGAKSLERAIEIQTGYARSAYEGFVAQTTRVGEQLTNIAKESYKPFEGIVAKATKQA